MKCEDGGPAFPCHAPIPLQRYQPTGQRMDDAPGFPPLEGMSLRDYFAAAALTGFLANRRVQVPIDEDSAELAAYRAYWIADKMIEEREVSV